MLNAPVETHLLTISTIQPRYLPNTLVEYKRDPGGELIGSIKNNGLRCPVIVHQYPDGSLRLVDGSRRLQAFRLAYPGVVEIPAIVTYDWNELATAVLNQAIWERSEGCTGSILPTEIIKHVLVMREVYAEWFSRRSGAHQIPTSVMQDIFGMPEHSLKDLTSLSSAFSNLITHGDTPHDPALALSLLEKVDSGELTSRQARSAYMRARGSAVSRKDRKDEKANTRKGLSAKDWQERMARTIASATILTEALASLSAIPDGITREQAIEHRGLMLGLTRASRLMQNRMLDHQKKEANDV